tara:strand:+ start:249 stop:641 length:393 start_codon:yes stop_codon:yes gene_type:complete
MKISKRQLRRIIKEEKAKLVSENNPRQRVQDLGAEIDDLVSRQADARAAVRHSDKNQLTLNQGEVDQVEAMRKALDKMYFEYQKIKSVPSKWLDDGNKFGTSRYDKLEELLMDAAEELSDLAADMKKGGI